MTPHYRVFDNTNFGKLRAVLSRNSLATDLYSPESPREMTLSETGKTEVGGLRYSRDAFHQLCAAVHPALQDLVESVAELPGQFDFEHALGILNSTIRAMFDEKLINKQMVVNRQDGVIEGLLGPRTHLLDNVELLDVAADTARRSDRDAVFHSAALCGRSTLLRFRTCGQGSTYSGFPDTHRLGFVFSHSEVGDRPLSGGLSLQCGDRDCFAYRPMVARPQGGGQRRTSNMNLENYVDAVFADVPAFDVTQSIAALTDVRLVPDPTLVGAVPSAIRKIAKRLKSRKVTAAAADACAQRALFCGGRDADSDFSMRDVTREDIAERNAYHLYLSIGSEAANLRFSARSHLEAAAWQLLVGGTATGEIL